MRSPGARCPPALTLNGATGVISGSPSATGPSTATITATDTGSKNGQVSLTITVYPVGVSSKLNPSGINGVNFNYALTAVGGASP